MKLAIVIPAQRAWHWHAVLVDRLRQDHDVDVFLAASSPYPRALLELLRLERQTAGPVPLAASIAPERVWPSAKPRTALSAPDYALVVDLADKLDDKDESLRLSFDGAEGELHLYGKLLAGRSPLIAVTAGSAPIVSSYPAIDDREVLLRALASAFSRMIALLVRAVSRHDELVREPALAAAGGSAQRYTAVAVLAFAARQFRIKLVRQAVKRAFRENHWLLAMARANERDDFLALDHVVPVELASTSYFADPFLYEAGGTRYLFAEEFPYGTRRGVIVCAVLGADGRPGAFRRVLERPYHLSYPFVFQDAGMHYMVPETSHNATVELYRAAAFPERWELDTILMENTSLADATLIKRGELWWMFGSARSFGGSSQDELVAFHSPSLRGPWTPHRRNPLVSDVRAARPAGRFVEWSGRLFRPAQDCEDGYGAAVVWSEILELSPDTFRERRIARWPGSAFGDYSGLHTYDALGDIAVIDLKRRRVRKS